MHEQNPVATPTTLEERMRLALDKIAAACPDSKGAAIQFELAIPHTVTGYTFYARIHHSEGCYGFGDTHDEAANAAIKAYGSLESRRAARIKKLEEEAAVLGLVISHPTQHPATAD